MATAQVATNPSGIPRAPFVDDVEKFVENGDIEPVMRKFNETLMTYKRMELSVLQRKRNLEVKLPELRKALAMVELLKLKAEATEEGQDSLEVQFELNDTLFANAQIDKLDRVCLWLGANVMVEYSVKEAFKLLQDKIAQAGKSTSVVQDDLEFLREQITTMEVNIARVYNWDVKHRRQKKA